MDEGNRNLHKRLCELNVTFLGLIFLRLTTPVSHIMDHRVCSKHLCTFNAARMAVSCAVGRRGRSCVSHWAVWSLTAVTSLDWSDKNEGCDAILFAVKPESCRVVQSGESNRARFIEGTGDGSAGMKAQGRLLPVGWKSHKSFRLKGKISTTNCA